MNRSFEDQSSEVSVAWKMHSDAGGPEAHDEITRKVQNHLLPLT